MVNYRKYMSIIFAWIFQQNLSWEAQKNPGNLWRVGNKQLQGTQHLLQLFPHPTEIAAPQQPVTAWKINIPELKWETRFPKRKEEERRNNAENKAKRQHISMKPDKKGKRPSAMPLTGEIAAQEYLEAIYDVTMSESRTTFPTSNGSSCRSSGEGHMDVSWCH